MEGQTVYKRSTEEPEMQTRGWRVTADRMLAVFISLIVVTSICPVWAHAEEDVFDPNRFPPIVAQAGNLTMETLSACTRRKADAVRPFIRFLFLFRHFRI